MEIAVFIKWMRPNVAVLSARVAGREVSRTYCNCTGSEAVARFRREIFGGVE